RLTAAEPLAGGQELTAGGKSAGSITSAGDGPGGPQALAYVKAAILDQDQQLSAGEIAVTIAA
ncbi:MAG: hypothetical protein PVJ75_12490, partial [Chloroflexota bacterium]